ncbi:hypothetical protein V7968_15275 [Nocardia vulneris]|uniref:hypothetical protein n=1 Tax=Nocardia vulneris TaxID=1141657 RepID=UPI0030CD5274
MTDRSIWQVAVGVGKPDREGPGALSSDDIHPIALLLEGSVVKVGKHIPCVTGFGAVSELAEAAVRLQGEDYDLAQIPFECTVTVYATDDEIDALLPVIADDLGLAADGYSTAADRSVSVGLRPIFDYARHAESYRYLVDQYGKTR